jgi:hypothetical protein
MPRHLINMICLFFFSTCVLGGEVDLDSQVLNGYLQRIPFLSMEEIDPDHWLERRCLEPQHGTNWVLTGCSPHTLGWTSIWVRLRRPLPHTQYVIRPVKLDRCRAGWSCSGLRNSDSQSLCTHYHTESELRAALAWAKQHCVTGSGLVELLCTLLQHRHRWHAFCDHVYYRDRLHAFVASVHDVLTPMVTSADVRSLVARFCVACLSRQHRMSK